ncbi:MAG TPA: hypothetical protein VD970_16955, partial [Acetobacteraceae bacterium]|nr:hypothetical protein [Acetobacteraceae bacterium]
LPPAACPRITILADGADLTRFAPERGQDLTAVVVDARIQGLNARCDYGRRGRTVEVALTVTFEVERGPAARGTVALPWFVAVTSADDERLIERRPFETGVAFPANVNRTRVAAAPVRMTFPIGEGRQVTDYNVRVSFLLTEPELAYNRRRGPR